MNPKILRFTQHDFAAFKAEARRVLQKLGLMDWYVGFEFSCLKDNSYAECTWRHSGRSAVLILNSGDMDERSYEQRDAKRSARHEVCELLLARFHRLCSDFASDSLVAEVTHDIIRRLEKVI